MRDSQRSKVYAAERAVFRNHPEGSVEFKGVEEAQRYITALCERKAIRKHFATATRLYRLFAPYNIPTVSMRRNGARISKGGGSKNRIRLAPPGNRWIAVHELAHCIASGKHDSHFARTYLRLVQAAFGVETAKALRDSYRKHGVKWHKKRKRNTTVNHEALAKGRERLMAYRAEHKARRDAAIGNPNDPTSWNDDYIETRTLVELRHMIYYYNRVWGVGKRRANLIAEAKDLRNAVTDLCVESTEKL